jgi:hypothetical protein
MIITVNAFVARVNFIFEKQTKLYTVYGDGSIAEDKFAIAQKLLWRGQPGCSAERSGAYL